MEPEPTTPKTTAAGDKMDIDETAVKDDEPKEVENKESKDNEKETTPAEGIKKKLEKEKVGYEIGNMSRVLPAQVKYLSFPDRRYEPVKKPTGGVMVVLDREPKESRETIELKVSKTEVKQAAAPGQPTQDQSSASNAPQTPAPAESGAAAAAGVLTAIDEDEEGGEEAPLPDEFDYRSDSEE